MSAQASPSLPKNTIFYACVLPPHRDYVTEALIFPGTNARDPYQLKGSFSFVCDVVSGGSVIARTEPHDCDELGHVRINLESAMKDVTEPDASYALVQLESTANIPVAFYFAHIHRRTGLYYPAPAIMFMGDMIYPHIHGGQLENTLFWPGVHYGSNTEFRLAMVNPYEVPMSVEVTGWHNTRGSCGSGVIRVSPHHCKWLALDDWLPAEWREDGEPISISVAAQFKLVAKMFMINRANGIITSADHLHTYQLH